MVVECTEAMLDEAAGASLGEASSLLRQFAPHRAEGDGGGRSSRGGILAGRGGGPSGASSRGGASGGVRDVTCFRCGVRGHVAPQCTAPPSGEGAGGRGSGSAGRGGGLGAGLPSRGGGSGGSGPPRGGGFAGSNPYQNRGGGSAGGAGRGGGAAGGFAGRGGGAAGGGIKCFNCGGAHVVSACPTPAKCRKCGKTGHLEKACTT